MRALLTSAILLITLPSFAQDGGLCATKPALKLKANPNNCRTELVPFRWQGSTRQVEMAAVTVGHKVDFDVFYDIENYLFRLPNDEIIKVDMRPAFPAFAMAEKPELASFRVQDELFYEYRAFEMSSRQLCTVAKLQYPFIGEARNCKEHAVQGHAIKLVPGVVSPAVARARVCALLTAEAAQCGGLRVMELVRTQGGELAYRLSGRVRLKNTDVTGTVAPELSIEYEERTYTISLDGVVSLESKFAEDCTHSQLTRPKKLGNVPQTKCQTHAPEDLR